MDRPRNPDRALRSLGLGAIGALVTACAGLGASNYTVSNINPIYFSGVESHSPQPFPESGDADATLAATTAFPGMPGDQYYYYRPPPVTASYDARASYQTADYDLSAEPARTSRDQPFDNRNRDSSWAYDKPASDTVDDASASDPAPSSVEKNADEPIATSAVQSRPEVAPGE
ncbi:MAG: hypothetical protein E7773_03195 [Sphingomonas sp.]|uniref:hypothetical protein n=1 Tax=Sphingomonas sp. TaxID=28214 RepID=UPI0011FF5999|nr:hypothetical protein [Sphingomonas sp.]THD37993.1 MAG: hypothetical protein E7773_03195 [Sphingomonas sp.]